MAPRRRSPRFALIAIIVLALAVGVGVSLELAPSEVAQTVDQIPGVTLDDDDDGLLDQVEREGWITSAGNTYQTDPAEADTDGDGLTDAEEAGPAHESKSGATIYEGWSDPTLVDSDDDALPDPLELGEANTSLSTGATYYEVSHPLVADTDEDGIGDGDEYFLDMDPLSPDTDGDGLVDAVELDFDSDPTLTNADGDSYPDDEEFENETNPLSYDFTTAERVAAGEGGLKYGDCVDCALDAGLKIEQVESAEYLAGHIASGVAIYGDFRDVGVNLWRHKFLAAGISALGLLPFIGDSSKAVAVLTKFAGRSPRAEKAVREVVTRLPMSDSSKAKVIDALGSSAGRLPVELDYGLKNNVVYMGCGQQGLCYVGITNNLPLRQRQHLRAGRTFPLEPIEGAHGLSRGEARAMEQACIVQGGDMLENLRNSISPTRSFYADAVAAGEALLVKLGGACPITAAP